MKKNNLYMSPHNIEKFNKIIKFLKIENIVTKPWSLHPAIPLCIFIIVFIVFAIDSFNGNIIIEKFENFINDGYEAILVISFLFIVGFVLLGMFVIFKFISIKKQKYGDDIYKIQNEIFSKILAGCETEIFLDKGLPEELLDFVEDNSETGDSFSSYEGFLSFRYKDILISRGLVREYNFSLDSKRKIYATWYVFKPNNEIGFNFEIGNNFKGKGCIPINISDSNKKLNILGENDKIQKFLTKKRVEVLSKLDKLVDDNFSISYENDLVIMRTYHGSIHPESLDIKYNDTIESYEAKFLNEVEKMKALVDFINNKK